MKISEELQKYIDKGHVRYMPKEIVNELQGLVLNCKGGPAEAMFWVIHNITDYPLCKGCHKPLTTKSWKPFLKPQLRDNPDISSGYMPYCGRSCSYTYGTKQDSYKKACLEKYGVDHPMKTQEVVEKLQLTNIKKYGEKNPNRWSGKQFQDLMESKYGTKIVRHIDGVSEKIAETKAELTAKLLPEKIKEIEKLFEVTCNTDLKQLKVSRIDEFEFNWTHTCGVSWSSNITFRGIRSCPSCWSGTSKGEQEVADFIRSLGVNIEQRVKNVISPRELDIWIPEKNIAIEYDGTYWHSAKFESEKKCMEKIEMCNKLGIQLITIQEHLWVNAKSLVKSRLSSILGFSNKSIYARNTKIRKIESNEGIKFLKENHLQGAAKASEYLGLFYNEDLVMVASFSKPRWNKECDWELIRLASKLDINVVGGASKLISNFKKNNGGKLLSYADRCWSQGNVYSKLGFTFSHNTTPSYWWIHHKFGAYSRYQTQKSKLENLLVGIGRPFYPELSETQNMEMSGFIRLYDRGNSVWVLK